MKRKKIVILFMVAVISFSYLFFYMKNSRHTIETDNVYTKTDIVPIAAKVSGYVNKVFVKDNQLVKKGDILFKIDDEDYKVKLELEKASVDIEKAKIQSLEEQISMQKSIIKQAQANLQSVLSSQELTDLNFKRTKKLYKTNAISTLAFDEKQNEKTKSHFNVIANKNKIEAEKKRLKVLVANKKMTMFQMKKAQSKVDLAKINLRDTSIVAPFDGVVANRQVQVGKYVKATANILSLVELNNIWLIANFKETQISDLQVNQEVEITIDGFKDVTFLGKIDSFSPGSGSSFSMLPPNNATGSFVRVVQRVPVKIVFSNTENTKKLLPGLSAEVSIDLGKKL